MAERRLGRSPGESALTAAARKTGMSEQQVLDLALARSAWKSMVAVRLLSPGAHLEWSRTPLPAITNLDAVRDASAFAGADKSRLFLNDTAPTARRSRRDQRRDRRGWRQIRAVAAVTRTRS